MRKVFVWIGGGVALLFVAFVLIGIFSDDPNASAEPSQQEKDSIMVVQVGAKDFGNLKFGSFLNCLSTGQFPADINPVPRKLIYGKYQGLPTVAIATSKGAMIFQYKPVGSLVYITSFAASDHEGNGDSTEDNLQIVPTVDSLLVSCGIIK
jgi:hypothetical protein